ncbi:MAG: M12 family metallo-peptidase, partial [Nocardioides sp.]
MSTSSRRRLGRAAAGAVPLALAASLMAHTFASSDHADASSRPAAPSFLTTAPSVAGRSLVRPQTSGEHRLVGLRPTLLPGQASGQRLSFPLFRGTTVTGTVDRVSTGPGYTAWTGRLTTPLGDFSIVRAGDVYRVDVSSLQGDFQVTPAGGTAYWLSRAATPAMQTHSDVAPLPAGSSSRSARGGHLVRRRLHDSGRVLDVMFAYNDRLVRQAGSVSAIRAYAGAVVSQTDQALAQSGDKRIRVRMVGLAHTGTKRAKNFDRNLVWLRKPHDGHYDGLVRKRNRRHADVVHLLLPGSDPNWCGFGYEPPDPRDARSLLGYSVSLYANCATNHAATHEIGHNMGADHDRYPGVSHTSQLKYAAGKVNTSQGWLSIMAYPNHVLAVN